MLAGGDMRFSGATGGDYLGAGGSQMVGGRIHGSIRAAGGKIYVAASIDRDATIAGGRIELMPAAAIERNAYLAGGMVQVDGTVHGELQVSGGTVILNGMVGSNAEVTAGELHVGPHAVINGNLRYRVPAKKVHIDPAARITGIVTALPVRDWSGTMRFFRFLWLIGFLIAGAVAVALAPRLATRAVDSLKQRPWLSTMIGFLWLIAVPVAAVLIAITIVGLPLALLSGAVYGVLVYLGRAVIAVWLGRMVLGARAHPGYEGAFKSFLTGGIILVLVAFVPGIGPLVMLLTTVCGVGALLLSIKDCKETQPV
jgi:hypothetical protein